MTPQVSRTRTLVVAGGVIFTCAILVSAAVSVLRPIQAARRAPSRSLHILQAAGLLEPGQRDSISPALLQQIETRWLDLAETELGEPLDPSGDYRGALGRDDLSVAIDEQTDIAYLGRRPIRMPVYFIHSNVSKAKLVLPIYGKGMWSMIHGYLALGADYNTIVGVHFYENEDTPGIGDRIQEPGWTSKWVGKKLYDERGLFRLQIGGRSPPAVEARRHHVDAISGATVTVTGVANFVAYWLGEDGYAPYLRRLRAGVFR